MKLVFTHPNHFAVIHVRHLLESHGIDCEVRNEFAVGAMGELAPIDVWPELWVAASDDEERARVLIDTAEAEADKADWYCSQCGERNAGSFEVCWACGAEPPQR
ncbi:DUF2007 domain-containing protein [Saccharospirillum sp.]|uniref:DUF2007 domain-containing protein n=1 Tax=Saccharospirillum sp. TaxID=2033801 RepID=UPI0034A0933F